MGFAPVFRKGSDFVQAILLNAVMLALICVCIGRSIAVRGNEGGFNLVVSILEAIIAIILLYAQLKPYLG